MVSVWMWIIPCTFHQGWRGTMSFLLSGGTSWENCCHISGQTSQKDCAGALLHFPQLLHGWRDRSRSVHPPEPYCLCWHWHCWLRVFPRLISGPGLPPSCRTHARARPWSDKEGCPGPKYLCSPKLRVVAKMQGTPRPCAQRYRGDKQLRQPSGELRGCFQCSTDINLKPSNCGCLLFTLACHGLQLSIPLHNQWGGVWIWTSPHLLKCWMGGRAGGDTG